MKDSVAQIFARHSTPAVAWGAVDVPMVVLALSLVLVLTSLFRRALETSEKRGPRWAGSSTALSLLRRRLGTLEVDDKAVAVESGTAPPCARSKAARRPQGLRRRSGRRVQPCGSLPVLTVPLPSGGSPATCATGAASRDPVEQGCASLDLLAACADAEAQQVSCDVEIPADPEPEEEDVCCCGAEAPWGCTLHRAYAKGLLLAHQEMSFRVARGPPGLDAPLAVAPSATGLRMMART